MISIAVAFVLSLYGEYFHYKKKDKKTKKENYPSLLKEMTEQLIACRPFKMLFAPFLFWSIDDCLLHVYVKKSWEKKTKRKKKRKKKKTFLYACYGTRTWFTALLS